MAEPLGLVPQRREGTGAAQILQPFNSAPIFQAYDQSMVQPKRPLMDSFGKDLNAGDGKVHPNDRWWIKEAQNKYFDSAAKIMARLQAEKRDLNADEQRELTLLKQDAADRVGVAQKQYEEWNKMAAKIAEAPYAYNQKEREAFNNYHNLKITERPLFPGVSKTPDTDIVKWIESIGDPTVKSKRKVVNPDNTSYEVEEISFDPKKASELFNNTLSPLLATTQQGQILTDIVRREIIDQDPSFTQLPAKDQAEIVDMAARDFYVNAKKNQYQYMKNTVSDRSPSKTGGTKTPTVSDLEPVVERQYLVYDKASGQRKVGKFKTDENTNLELRDVISFPVAGLFGSKTPQENSERFNFIYKGQAISGSPQQIRTYKGNTGNWSDYFLVLVDREGMLKEVPLTGSNRKKLEQEFGFSLDELEKKFPDVKKQADELPVATVEAVPEWNTLNEKQKDVYRKAWEKRFGKGAGTTSTQQATEPAPAPKTDLTKLPGVTKR